MKTSTEFEVQTHTPMLTLNETIAKIVDFQKNGNIEARNAVVEGNMGLVIQVANKYKNKMEFDDAVQVAVTAMIRACDDYDPAEAQFSTYAITCMKAKLNRDVENNSRTVRLPSCEQNLIREYKRVASMLRCSLNRTVYPDEVGAILVHHKEIASIKKKLAKKDLTSIDEEKLLARKNVLLEKLGRKTVLGSQSTWTLDMANRIAALIENRTGSLDADPDKEGSAPLHFVSDERTKAPDAEMDMEDAMETLRVAIKRLNDRQKDILQMRFFENKTLDEIAGNFVNPKTGKVLSRERIRQIEEETIMILRTHLGSDPRNVVARIALHVQAS